MVTLKLNGTPYQCKSRPSEITCGDLERIFSEWDVDKDPIDRDYGKLACILSGADFKTVKLDSSSQEAIWIALKDIIGSLWSYSKEVPETLMIDDRTLPLVKSVRKFAVGPNILIRQALEKSKYYEQCLSLALALYLQPAYDDSKAFNSASAQKLQEKIKALPAEAVYGAGFFILRRAQRSGESFAHVLRRILINLKQSLRRTLQSSLSPEGLQGSLIC